MRAAGGEKGHGLRLLEAGMLEVFILPTATLSSAQYVLGARWIRRCDLLHSQPMALFTQRAGSR